MHHRDDEKAGYYRMDSRRPKDSSSGQDVICVAGESIRPRLGDLQGRAFQFDPPSLIRWYTYQRDQVCCTATLSYWPTQCPEKIPAPFFCCQQNTRIQWCTHISVLGHVSSANDGSNGASEAVQHEGGQGNGLGRGRLPL